MKIKAVFESALAGLVTAIFSYWVLINPATLVALEIRRKYPMHDFSSMITWYAAFVVMGTSLVLAAVASWLIYKYVAGGTMPQPNEDENR